jgi:hypothetical protein
LQREVHVRRSIIIVIVSLATAVVVLLFLARHIRYQLAERPYIAAVKTDLRALAAAQTKYRTTNASFASDAAQLPVSRDSTVGAWVRIVAASADGFLAEGRHSIWTGRCQIAVGAYTGDSLKGGEPRCYSS